MRLSDRVNVRIPPIKNPGGEPGFFGRMYGLLLYDRYLVHEDDLVKSAVQRFAIEIGHHCAVRIADGFTLGYFGLGSGNPYRTLVAGDLHIGVDGGIHRFQHFAFVGKFGRKDIGLRYYYGGAGKHKQGQQGKNGFHHDILKYNQVEKMPLGGLSNMPLDKLMRVLQDARIQNSLPVGKGEFCYRPNVNGCFGCAAHAAITVPDLNQRVKALPHGVESGGLADAVARFAGNLGKQAVI